ncbi:hypothetical protein PK35_12750 [Tamlana nanhaiensis]|uniref:Uncharacterized protein n=1 Tax=Neotamlana nanhaiensis TaxID=1382798 RepID=A0A0D7VYB0_9FLAO|nr:hypothetical protein [Tamlana nanhaiensis]KJD31865.1 hypothetical protein PK35_12750 [Tamlana nanhaiensis]
MAQTNNSLGLVKTYQINNASYNKKSSIKVVDPITRKTTNSGFKKIRMEFNGIEGSYASRELLLGFSDNTSDGFDYGYDAEVTLHDNDLSLDLNGVDYGIQAYAELTPDKVIKLNHNSSGANRFVINITELENIEVDQAIYLIDNTTGDYIDLSSGSGYEFESSQGNFTDRFQIAFQNPSVVLSANKLAYNTKNMYFHTHTNTFYAKALNTTVKKLILVNLNGQKVLELNNVSHDTLEAGINLNHMAANAYAVMLQTDNKEILTKKFVIN